MKRIILSLIMIFMLAGGVLAQYTYHATFNDVSVNTSPGLNTNNYSASTGNGWSVIIPGSQATNTWTPTQALPFPFDFFGTSVTHYKVSGNGVLTFDTTATTTPTDNTNLPAGGSANIPNNSILAFWDAFTGAAPTGSNDQLWVKEFGTAPNRELWFIYYSYEYGVNAAGTGNASSFTYYGFALQESTNKIFVVDYQFSGGGANLTGTVGLQKDAAVAVQYGDSTLVLDAVGAAGYDYWEFTPFLLVADNAGITSVDAPFAPLSTGLQDVKVTLKNHGSNALTSATINWAVNGVTQTPFAWTGSLASQTSSASPVTVGQYNFGLGNFNVEAWTSLPNGVADNDPTNDTSSISLCTPLAGTFTVGGMGATYATISDAVNAVASCGVGGPITFNIAAGTYNESLTIPDLIGASATNTITFNGAGAANTSLVYDGSGTQNATVLFDGGDYVTFKNMTIERALGGSYNWGVRMQNASDWNTFDSCTIKVDKVSTSSLYIPFLTSNSATSSGGQGSNASYTTISNCDIEGGYYGVRFYGSTSGYNYYNKVENSRIKDHYAYGIYNYYQDSCTAIGNTIEASRATFGYGIYGNNVRHIVFNKNLIKEAMSMGIYCASCNTTGTSRGQVINNMITAAVNGDGIYFSNANNIDVFHNSVYSQDDPAYTQFSAPTGMDIRNNIFYTETDRVVDFSVALTGTTTFNYNVVWRGNSGTLVEDGTYQAPDMASWKLAQPAQNSNSIEADPNYVDAANNDLHVNVGPGLIAGDNSAGVMEDFDGDARPQAPTTVVDIGADEIFVQNLDAGVVSFDSPLPPVTSGLNPIQVSIKNNGATPLTGVTINWTANGVLQTPFAWVGSITIGQEANNVTIGNYNITTGFTQFVVWTSAPNAGTDGDTGNDTLWFDLCTPLSGTINVGGATPDFNTIGEAADAMSFCGVSGAVTVNIAPGVYNETIVLGEAPGASSTNTITFDGLNRDSVLLTSDAANEQQPSTVLFDGGDYYTLKNMTIENSSTTVNARVIHLWNQANDNTIEDNTILSDTTTTSSLRNGIIASASATSTFGPGDNCNDLTVRNNDILGGYYGTYFYGGTGSEAALNNNNIVEGNYFENQYAYGSYMIYQADPEFNNNEYMPFRATFGYGIYCGEAMLPKIQGNRIHEAGTYGIYMFDVNFDYPANKPAKLVNNMVKTIGAGDAFGLDDCDKVDIFHNTGRSVTDQAFYTNDVTELNIRNNIFITDGSEAFEFLDAIDAATTIDYNIYERTDGGDLIEIGTAFHADLAAWTTATPTLNVNSSQGNPLFVDEAAGDLHVIGALANDTGDNGAGITIDIDGDARPESPSTTVDIGADEYTPLLNDLNLVGIFVKPSSCNLPNDSVWAIVQSLGLTPATAFSVTANVTGGVTTTLNSSIAANISLGNSDTVYVGSFNSSTGGFYNIDAFVSLTGDQNNTNDTTNAITVQRMSAPNGTVTDVACFGDSSGMIDLDFVGTGTIATVDETQYLAGNAATMAFSFSGLQGISGVDLVITGHGDLDGTGGNLEEYAIYDENGNYIGQYGAFGSFAFQCADAPANTIAIHDTTYANWAADGVITFSAVATSAVSTTLCPGAFLQLKLTGNGTPNLLWSNGDTTETITGLAAGNYTVSVTDLLGCMQTASFTVNQSTNPSPTLSATSTDISCYGAADGAIDVTVAGGTGAISYLWNDSTTTEDLTGLAPGSYSVIASDVNGCSDSTATAIVITQPDSLNASAGGVTVGCDSVAVAATVAGGTMPYSFSWNSASTDSSTIAIANGTYDVTVTDANGCTDDASFTVTLPAGVSATGTLVAADTSGAGVGSATVTASGGVGPYTYAWANGDTSATATGISGGNIDVTVTDANGCFATITVTVPFPTGTENWSVVGNIDMFPNPTNGLVTFNVALKETADLSITIFNVAGQEMTTLHSSNENLITKRFDTSHLAEGVYMVRFIAGDDVITKRLVVSK